MNVTKNLEPVMLNENVPEFSPPEAIAVTTGLTLSSGVPVMTGLMPLGMILDNYEIPYYEAAAKDGYQRPPQVARVNKLANDLRRGVDTPTAILINIRDTSILDHVSPDKSDVTLLSSSILAKAPFYVVDGQHRILGYEKAINDGWFQGLERLIPFTCLLGADQEEEMKQFYVVNSTAKAVRTDLAFALLKRRIENEDALIETLQAEGKAWQVEGQRIVEELASSSEVWKGRIKLPGMVGTGTTMPSASMVNSLKAIIESPFFARLDSEKRVAVIDAYWGGVKLAIPDVFADPKQYSVQKGVGVSTFHDVLPEIVELVRFAGDAVTDPEAFAGILNPALAALQGQNSAGEEINGAEFWRAGEAGAAGAYSSGAGKRLLAAKLRAALPEIS